MPASWRSTSTAPWRRPKRRPRWRRSEPAAPGAAGRALPDAGRDPRARAGGAQAVELGAAPLADIVQGYADLAALRGAPRRGGFRRALAAGEPEPDWRCWAWAGADQAGDLAAGTAAARERRRRTTPAAACCARYLGKAYFEERRDEPAAKQYAIAKELDPTDPTPWFYDAIRLQLDNRPVAALRDLERSIALNDDRAPFRSRLLLDQDRPTRGASLARIYQDLGFASWASTRPPGAGARPGQQRGAPVPVRLYQGEPRLEAARVSELLQAQLLQPVGMNPVQPSLASPTST